MNTNHNTNTNELIEKLNVILQMEESKFNGIRLPHTDEEQDMFSRGYAEGISDIIYLLKQSMEEYKPEVVDLHLEEYKVTKVVSDDDDYFKDWKVVEDDAWMDDIEMDDFDKLLNALH